MKTNTDLQTRKLVRRNTLKENAVLLAIMSPVIIYLLLFCYVPMYGIVIAFQDYFPGSSFFALNGSVKWVGLKHFINFFKSEYFWRLTKNTLVLSGLQLGLGFLVPIIFALLLNEIKSKTLRKFYQTASYLPYFISTVVVASMVLSFLEADGMINRLLGHVGIDPIKYTTDPTAFPWVYTITNIWKSFGWNSIIYLAAISGVDPEIYEAARIDGANRFQQMMKITLPSISGTIFVLFVFAIGSLLNTNSEFILLIYNRAIYETSDVYGTYIYRMGITSGKFSATTAVGLFIQVLNVALLIITNQTAKRVNGYSLW